MNSISVVIPTYHRYDALRGTVMDLLNQKRPPDQIIVVDNTDLSARQPPDYFASTEKTECVYVSSCQEGRVNVARNEGLSKVTSTFVLFFDDDMSVPEECIANFMAVHEEGWDAVTGAIQEQGRILDAKEFSSNRPLWRLLRTQHGETRGTTIGVPSGFVSIRTTALKGLGGFDETFIYHYDDYDLGLRLWKGGFAVVRDPRVTVTHLKAPSGGGRMISGWHERRLNKYRAKYYFMTKHFNKRAARLEVLTDIMFIFSDRRGRPFAILKELRVIWRAISDPLFKSEMVGYSSLFLMTMLFV
jgi:GT2 family glycosyltransferase